MGPWRRRNRPAPRCVAVCRHETKAVAAFDVVEGRNVEDFAGGLFRAKNGFVEQVAMALAKGVVHLNHDGAQGAVGTVAIPKADGFEGVAKHARVAVQPDFARGVVDAFAMQQFVKPSQCICAAVAMVFVVKTQGCPAVAFERVLMMLFVSQRPHGQHQKIRGVGKRMPRV